MSCSANDLERLSSVRVMSENRSLKTNVGGANVVEGTMTETMVETPLLEEVHKIEVFDVEFANQLRSNPDVPKDERDKLRRYVKKTENINHVKVIYKLGKAMRSQHLNLGRLCPTEGIGLQSFQRDVRAALTERYYWDVDIVNAQPTLIVQYCEREGWDCRALKRYVEMRDEILSEMCRNLSIERWESKERIIALLYGGNAEGLTPFITRELYPEVRRITSNVWTKNAETLKWLKNQPNFMGRGMAYIFQTEERKVLLALDRALTRRGRSLDVLIHDGGLVRKKANETEFPTRILREVEEDIKEETSYVVRLSLKPLETTIERDGDADAEYERKKIEWEENGDRFGNTYFKLLFPSVFVALNADGKMTLMSKTDLLQNEENNFLTDGTLFIKKWLADPTLRTYQRLVFAPKKEVPSYEYNIFTGFAVPPKESGDISRVKELLYLISGKDDRVVQYIEKWLAVKFQRPWMKTKVCIIVYGEEGVGKETFWNFVGSILGSVCFYNTKTPEHDVFAKFNFGTEKALLVKMEEANFQTNKENADKLKGLITQETENYEQKGKDKIVLNDYRDYVMTTNHHTPITMTEHDRRFMMVNASNDRKVDKHSPMEVQRANSDWWNETYALLDKEETKSAYHHYLLNVDITDFVPQRDRIFTDYYQEVQSKFTRHYHSKWFQTQLEMDDERTESFEWRAKSLFNDMKGGSKFELNETNFGRDLKQYIEAGVLTKKRDRWGVAYICDPQKMKAFLVEKGWWFEF